MGLSAGTVKRQVLEDNRGPAILCEPNESFRKSMEFSDERDSSPAVLPDQEGVSSLAGRASCSAQVFDVARNGFPGFAGRRRLARNKRHDRRVMKRLLGQE